jgi:hypothetical protein
LTTASVAEISMRLMRRLSERCPEGLDVVGDVVAMDDMKTLF